jgi:cardiolipin synthase
MHMSNDSTHIPDKIGTTWRFYRWSKDAWNGMLEALESAEHSIDFEQYYFVDLSEGLIGHRFLEVLERKARQGVKVRLLLDATGSWEFYRSPAVNDLKQAGIDVEFHSTLPLKDANWFFQSFLRDHRRLIVVDGRVGLVGGTAIKEAAEGWRDTHVWLEGPVVRNLQIAFEEAWEGLTSRRRFRITSPSVSQDKFTVLPNGIRPSLRFIPHSILEGIQEAQKCIYITTPYFAPDHAIFRALVLAALRGVEVRLLVPERSDSRFANLVTESFFSGALREGIKVYRYVPSFLHSKTIVIDDDWGTVGSSNFDQLSFHLNYELNVLSYDAKFALELKNHFFDDLQSSIEVVPKEWKRRHIVRKILEKLSFIARPFV